jgi:hypothetical protein
MVSYSTCKSIFYSYQQYSHNQHIHFGSAMAQATRPLTAEARVRSQVSPCGIFGGQSDTATGYFSRVLGVSPLHFIPPVLHYTVKRKKKHLIIIFIAGLHNKP